jgi:hypothetical protein
LLAKKQTPQEKILSTKSEKLIKFNAVLCCLKFPQVLSTTVDIYEWIG